MRLKQKIRGSQGEKLTKRGIETTAVTQKSTTKNIETFLPKQFFPPYLSQAAKIYVATSYSVVRQETIEISEQRTAFEWFFAQEVDWSMKDCDKQRLQTTVSINLWKILAGHTGDWFDVKTASIWTTELWDALKSFILTSLKFKVAPYPIIVSLDTLSGFGELVVSVAMMTDADACDVEPAAKRHRPDLTKDKAGQLLRDAVSKKTRQSTEFWVRVVKGFSSEKGLDVNLETDSEEKLDSFLKTFYSCVRTAKGELYQLHIS